ncbi:MAG: cyanophycinase [Planctomycetales bacterium]
MSACVIGLVLALGAGCLCAAEPPLSSSNLSPPPGTLFICGGGKLPDPALLRFVEMAGGERAHLVVITTASETADSAEVDFRIDFWKKARMAEMTVLHTRSRDVADDPEFYRPLTTATAVWFIGGHQNRLTDAYQGTKTEQAIREVLGRGGIVGGTSAGAAVMSPVMILGGNPRADIGEGFGFLPGTVVDQHFLKRKRQDRLVNVLTAHPKLVGVGIDEGTALVVQGRKMWVLRESESNVVAYLAPVDGKPARTMTLTPGDEMDLVALRRAAHARLQPRWRFDDEQPDPVVSHGTLVLVGGGEIPTEAASRFIAAAGGPDAPIVVVSTADGDQPPPEAEALGWLAAAGARNLRRLHARTPQEAESPEVLNCLQQADGVWFTGGRQWRLVDAYADTAAERLLEEVLKRGGAVGGSAAGASILAAYLVRGNPLGNRQMMADGYEEGFGLLPGAALDPYFTQRNRLADMLELKRAYPHLIGLGLDESTAIVIQGPELEVLGKNRLSVFHGQSPLDEELAAYDVLLSGDRYDLRRRRRLGRDDDASQEVILASAPSSEPDGDEEDAISEAEDPQPQPALVCE